MKLKITFLLSVLLYILILNFTIAFAQSIEENMLENGELEIEAPSAVLIDDRTGTIIFEKDKDKKVYPASITKIMTTLLAIEYGKLDDILTVSHNAVYGIGPGSSHIGIKEGEQLTLEQAIYGVILMSANELSVAVAEHIDGTVEAFAKHMTMRAKEIGAVNTNFTNPHGLHDNNHYTTAYDMALIMQEALKNKEFREIIGTYAYQIPPTNKNEKINYLANQHQMFRNDTDYSYDGVIGGKTGFTDQAMYTLVTAATRDDLTLISVVMHGNTKGSRYSDSVNIFDYGFSNFYYKQIFDKSNFSFFVPVEQIEDGEKVFSDVLETYAKDDIELLVNKDFIESKLLTEPEVLDILTASVKMDDKIGKLNFIYDGNILASVDLFAKYSVTFPETLPVANANKPVSSNDKNPTDLIPIAITIMLVISVISFLVIISLNSRKRRFLHYKK